MKVTSQCYEEFDDVTKNSALVVFRRTKSGLNVGTIDGLKSMCQKYIIWWKIAIV